MNPKCPICGYELRIGHEMYLRSIVYDYFCDAEFPENKDCKFRFSKDWRFWSEKALLDRFTKTFYPEYQI